MCTICQDILSDDGSLCFLCDLRMTRYIKVIQTAATMADKMMVDKQNHVAGI